MDFSDSHLQIVRDGKTIVDLHGWKAVVAVLPVCVLLIWGAFAIVFL